MPNAGGPGGPKLIVLTERGQECIAAGLATIDGLEQRIIEVLGPRGHQQLRRLLEKLLDAEDPGAGR
jgi:DNA-binding MarR family transcriptional regulator